MKKAAVIVADHGGTKGNAALRFSKTP